MHSHENTDGFEEVASREQQHERPVRKCVHDFAVAMEARLVEFEHKGGWDKLDYSVLESKLDKKVKRVHESVDCLSAVVVRDDCADAANYLMMIVDNINKEEEAADGQSDTPQR